MDLCLCRTKAHFLKEGNTHILTLDPVEIAFYDLTVKLQTVISFEEGSSEIKTERKILEMSDPNAEVEIDEYRVACYGTTEYSEDMLGITLSCTKDGRTEGAAGYVREEYAFSPMFTLGYTAKVKDKEEYYCMRCQFKGSEEEVLKKMRWQGFVMAQCTSGLPCLTLKKGHK